MDFHQVSTEIVGWLYFICWGVMPYPQVILNYKLKSVEGLKLDYCFINLFGYIMCTIAYSVARFDEDLPLRRYGLGILTIQDMFYAYNGTFANIVLNVQSLYYPRGKNSLSWNAIGLVIFGVTSSIIYLIISEVAHWIPITEKLNVIEYLTMMKAISSFTKYPPLIYYNYKRKCTMGFSVITLLFSFAGGILALIHQTLSFYSQDPEQRSWNYVKSALATFAIIYDTILLVQHYVLYADGNKKQEEMLLLAKTDGMMGTPTVDGMNREGSFYRMDENIEAIQEVRERMSFDN